MQTGGHVECSIPIGIPTKNKNNYKRYKSTTYRTNSNYPGPPNTKQTKTRQVRVLLHLRCGISSTRRPCRDEEATS
jgi:hypothetical protein